MHKGFKNIKIIRIRLYTIVVYIYNNQYCIVQIIMFISKKIEKLHKYNI